MSCKVWLKSVEILCSLCKSQAKQISDQHDAQPKQLFMSLTYTCWWWKSSVAIWWQGNMEASKKSKELLTTHKIKYLHLTLLQSHMCRVFFFSIMLKSINMLLSSTTSDNEAICMKCYNRAVAQLQSAVIWPRAMPLNFLRCKFLHNLPSSRIQQSSLWNKRKEKWITHWSGVIQNDRLKDIL